MDYSQIGDPNFSPYGDTTAVVTTLQQTLMTDREQHKFGVWVANISYAKGDIVYHHTGTDGGLYGSLVSQNRGFSPLNGDKWRLLMAVSGVGGSGGGLTNLPFNAAVVETPVTLNLPTPDGLPTVTHPNVLFTKDNWNGVTGVLAYTPFPNAAREMPVVTYSSDGINWSLADGAPNPIVSYQEVSTLMLPQVWNTNGLWAADMCLFY